MTKYIKSKIKKTFKKTFIMINYYQKKNYINSMNKKKNILQKQNLQNLNIETMNQTLNLINPMQIMKILIK